MAQNIETREDMHHEEIFIVHMCLIFKAVNERCERRNLSVSIFSDPPELKDVTVKRSIKIFLIKY